MKSRDIDCALLSARVQTDLLVKEKKVSVITELDLIEQPLVTTRIQQGNKILTTKKIEILEVLNLPNIPIRVQEIICRHHLRSVISLSSGTVPEEKTPSEYIDELKGLLRKKNLKSALLFLDEALSYFPDDPFILSYHGCLESIVSGRHDYGIKVCRRALKEVKDRIPFGEEYFYPVFYLNLGRAYAAAGKKREALSSFKRGLLYDKENGDLLWEMKKLGQRKKPPISLLRRSHPLNKYIGKLLHKLNP